MPQLSALEVAIAELRKYVATARALGDYAHAASHNEEIARPHRLALQRVGIRATDLVLALTALDRIF